jgi:hypothetical protein
MKIESPLPLVFFRWPFNSQTASFKKKEPLVFFRSPSQRNRRPCHHCSCNNGPGVFIAKKNACHSPTIKAGEGMRTGGKKEKEKERTGDERRGKKKEAMHGRERD